MITREGKGLGVLGVLVLSKEYRSRCPTYCVLGGGRMDELQYVITEIIEHKGMQTRILRPVATEEEVSDQIEKTIAEFIRAITQ